MVSAFLDRYRYVARKNVNSWELGKGNPTGIGNKDLMMWPTPESQKAENYSAQADLAGSSLLDHPGQSQTVHKRSLRMFTLLREPLEDVLKMLMAQQIITPLPPPNHCPNQINYNPSKNCAYHSNAMGHSTESCWSLKHKIQNMIETKKLIVTQMVAWC